MNNSQQQNQNTIVSSHSPSESTQVIKTESIDILISYAKQLGEFEKIHSWLEAKKIKTTDLNFAKLMKTEFHWNLFIKSILLMIEFKCTYSESIKNLEMISDLILMGHEESLFENSYNAQQWFQHLFRLRFPQTAQRDDELKEKFEKLSWPFGAKTKFERRGDRAGMEVKLFISSEADLIKIISSLERVKEQLSQSN